MSACVTATAHIHRTLTPGGDQRDPYDMYSDASRAYAGEEERHWHRSIEDAQRTELEARRQAELQAAAQRAV
jgi:hypothetical protein